MLWSFVLILLLTTGEIERYESPPLPPAECLALRKEKKADAEQRMDLRGLVITACEVLPTTAMNSQPSMNLIERG